MRNDGPWDLPEQLKKVSSVLGLSDGSAARGWNLSLMAYDARWQSTDQVPQRAVDSGQIGRFGSIDSTDGGSTSRYSASGEWRDRGPDGGVRLAGYAMQYHLQLFSNFTYALDRPEGDQFEQNDARTALGLSAARDWSHAWLGRSAQIDAGVEMRHDRIHVGLFDTLGRQRTMSIRDDQVRQTSLGAYIEDRLPWTDWFRTAVGLRADSHRFRVDSSLDANSGASVASKLSPKFSAIFGPWARTELFFNAGRGFHSNDARGTTARVDPRGGGPLTPVPGLVSGKGYEWGLRSEAVNGLQTSIALWRLDSDSELVYIGDAGTTEEGAPSRRRGVEWSNRWIPVHWFLLDADLAWTRSRFADGSRIEGAVERVASIATTLREIGPWSASLQWRYLGHRPLLSDNSVRAPSTLLMNLRVARKLGEDLRLTLDIFNLADRRANDIEYFYASKLASESAPVEGRHVHPAEPRSVRLTLLAKF